MPADPWYDYLRGLGEAVRRLFSSEARERGQARSTGLRNPENPLAADPFAGSEMGQAEQFTVGYDTGTGLLLFPFTSDYSRVPLDFGTAQGGTASTITLRAGASAVDDFYVGEEIYLPAGTGLGQQSRVITDYVGATKVATIAPDWETNPDNTSEYVVGPPHFVLA